MNRWTVRRAAPGDEDAVIAIEAQSFGSRSWGPKNVSASFDAAGAAVLLACDAAKLPQGFAIWRSLGEDAELLAIGVLPAARRFGVGFALLQRVIDEARAGAAIRLLLEVDAQNNAARALYKTAGFETLSVRKRYYRDGADAIVMHIVL